VSSADAKRLAGEIERALASGQRDLLSTEALQVLMAAVCKVYGARVEAGEQLLPLPERGGATATDVMVTASGLLKAANLAVFGARHVAELDGPLTELRFPARREAAR